MPDELGPHLLGRRPNTPDDRDFTLDKLESIATPPDDIAGMTLEEVHAQFPYLSSWWGYLVLWRWIKTYFAPPLPMPVPKPTFGEWGTTTRLDQGPTGHCVGFGWSDWGNSTPVADTFADTDGHAIYYEAKVIDGEPGQENGSSTRSGAQAMQNRGRLAAYGFAADIDEVNSWLDNHGPVVTGTDWTTPMFYPDADGRVTVQGGKVEGGHEWVILDRDPNTRTYEALNSWGNGWGKGGLFFLAEEDYARLLAENGDACLALELPR